MLEKEAGLSITRQCDILSIANRLHLKYPYLLRGLKITRPNQVWSTDITFIRMKKGFVYLTQP